MQQVIEEIQRRNQAIGQVIQGARERKSIPATKCAEVIGTSRRRYAAMERGAATIGVAELEVLMEFLEIPPYQIWGGERGGGESSPVVVQALPGQTVQIVVVDGRK